MRADFFVVYPGELTSDDRNALDRPGFKLYENGMGVSAVWRGDEGPDGLTVHQVVRVAGASEEDARRQVIDALGREPDGLRVHTGQ